MKMIALLAVACTFVVAGSVTTRAADSLTLKTDHARFTIDGRGFITSIAAINSGKEYSPIGHQSPLLSLHESGQPNDKLVLPSAASFPLFGGRVTLKYPGGATAVIKVAGKGSHLRFQLLSLEPRGTVDNVVWGPVNTTITGKIGDLTGVVRDADFAIGMLGLDDNTITGPVEDGDCYGMGYFIHSSDPKRWPLDPKYKDGQWFNIGGDGVSDTAFYSHPEEYFNQVMGSGAKVEPEFGSSVVYHARDRRRSYVHYYSLLPGFKIHAKRHMVSDPLPGVDFIGSGIALYACPDDAGLKTIEAITKAEGLPYITTAEGKWVRDPSALRPVLNWGGPVEHAIEYAKAMGFKDISRDGGGWYPSRGNTSEVIRVEWKRGTNIPYKEFSDQCHAAGLTHGGLHTLTVFLPHSPRLDVSPIPSQHLQTVCRTKLARDISATDMEIEVTDPSFLTEGGCWPENGNNWNFIRIGNELLQCHPVGKSAPWIMKVHKRGYITTQATPHKAGEELVKLMQSCYGTFIPDMTLLLEYADYYADLMARNGMDNIGFDGFESITHQHQGYYACRTFCRRLFDSYHKRTGRYPYITTASCVFGGSWEYYAACNVGGGNHMFNPATGRWGIEGKDIRNAWSACWFPPTFGIQGWRGKLEEAETLMSMATAWDATFFLSASQAAIDNSPDKDAIFKAFSAWQEAREKQLFTKAQKERMKDSSVKFHLEKTADGAFVLHTLTFSKDTNGKDTWVAGPGEKVGK